MSSARMTTMLGCAGAPPAGWWAGAGAGGGVGGGGKRRVGGGGAPPAGCWARAGAGRVVRRRSKRRLRVMGEILRGRVLVSTVPCFVVRCHARGWADEVLVIRERPPP